MPRFAILSPIKRNRRVIKSGFVTMSAEAAEDLVNAGTLAPAADRADGSDVAVAPAIEDLITRAKDGDGDAIMALGALAQKLHDEHSTQPVENGNGPGAGEPTLPAKPAAEATPKAPKAPKALKPKATKAASA